MIDNYIAYTNLLVAYISEPDKDKRVAIRYELLLLQAEFKAIYG